ncbi:DHHW family protein [Paenibacillus arenilitoris]|uniref:DHHW protein n=1 Tax=Paenibacillus arenilitoris TaxID=2772299 RepID=A0A927CKA3_9BACL|nr:DHHW family protein [Paenibacillus arenilitoris]MBD2869025.1 hypothetical protein [Paenibacillus arenilitoris]
MSLQGRDAKLRSITALALLVFVGAMAAANLLTPDRSFSESENRVLESLPALTLRSFLSGTFAADYEDYATDQFALRDVWIGLKTDTDRLMGKRDSNGVYLGEDNVLIQHFEAPTNEEIAGRASAIRSFNRATPGLRKYVMLVPTAAALHRDKLPAFAPVGDERAALNRVREALGPGIPFVDVYSALDAEREAYLYYRTDHHWTTKGAYFAYRALCDLMGITPKDEEAFDIRQATDTFYGSLHSKSGFRHLPPDRIDLYVPREESFIQVKYVDEGLTADTLYALDQLSKKDKYAVFLNGNHALLRIATAVPGGKKLLVVKDSYANSLIPFLTEHFAEIDVVDLRYYGESLTSLVQERHYDDMLILYNTNTFFADPSIMNLTE